MYSGRCWVASCKRCAANGEPQAVRLIFDGVVRVRPRVASRDDVEQGVAIGDILWSEGNGVRWWLGVFCADKTFQPAQTAHCGGIVLNYY